MSVGYVISLSLLRSSSVQRAALRSCFVGSFKKHAQDGRGAERPPKELRSVSFPMVARIRALCASARMLC